MHYSNIAKLCGFTEYQRKHIKDRLKELYTLGAIRINTSNLSNLTIHVNYDKVEDFADEDSRVNKKDYKVACSEIMEQLTA